MAQIKIFDTTLRDGEQSPGASMTASEKIRMAHELQDLGVDIIEAGFAASSSDEVRAIRDISREIKRPVITALARANEGDVIAAAKSLQEADSPRIHVFIATSNTHLERKLGINRGECIDRAVESIRLAASYVEDVEFSAEDATRTDLDFLTEVVRAAVQAGATTINLPDTVGYALPSEIQLMIEALQSRLPELDQCTLSVHCHDDLGLAVANSLAGIAAGARQVECTVNGIGERAGNAALEEIVMGLKVREDELDHRTGVRSEHIYRASRLLSYLTGIHPQPNKAIVGRNAFAHEAGIHQHGVLKDPSTYEIMTPEMVGVPQSKLVLGKHSGRHGLEARLGELGYTLEPEELDRVAASFKELADQKKDILDEDIISILNHGVMEDVPEAYRIDALGVTCGSELSKATITVLDENGIPRIAEGEGEGPIAAVFAAADTLHDFKVVLEEFEIRAMTPGRDAVGEVTIRARVDGQTFTGRGGSTDVVLASAQAYVHVLNKGVQARELEARHFAARTDWGV